MPEELKEDANTQILREMLKWVKLQGINQAKTVLTAALRNDKEKLIYEYSDGTKAIAEIAKLTGVGFGTVQRCWGRWATLGIVEPVAVQGGTRYKKAFSLQVFGIEVPQLGEDNAQPVTTEQQAEPATPMEEAGKI